MSNYTTDTPKHVIIREIFKEPLRQLRQQSVGNTTMTIDWGESGLLSVSEVKYAIKYIEQAYAALPDPIYLQSKIVGNTIELRRLSSDGPICWQRCVRTHGAKECLATKLLRYYYTLLSDPERYAKANGGKFVKEPEFAERMRKACVISLSAIVRRFSSNVDAALTETLSLGALRELTAEEKGEFGFRGKYYVLADRSACIELAPEFEKSPF